MFKRDDLNDAKLIVKLVSCTGQRGELLRNGVKVALVGAPNAGKSTLLNLLAGRYRTSTGDVILT